MKIKVKSILILLSITAVVGIYFQAKDNDKKQDEAENKPSVSSVQPASKKTKNFTHPTNNISRVYWELDKTLIHFSPDASMQLDNLADIAQCPICLQRLQEALLTGYFSDNQLTQLVNLLSRGNHVEIAKMLIDTAVIALKQDANNLRGGILLNGLDGFNSVKTAKLFTRYIVDAQEIPMALLNVLRANIDATTNRSEVTAAIVKQFKESNISSEREKLLAINHPEALAQINTQALFQGDTELYQKTYDLLTSNPSQYALDALLSLKEMQYRDVDKTDELIKSAYELASRQFSGIRLDYIESKLYQGVYSEQEKSLILDILSHSEDQIRSAEIIDRFAQ